MYLYLSTTGKKVILEYKYPQFTDMKLLRLKFNKKTTRTIPAEKKRNVRIEIVGPLNNVIYSIEFISLIVAKNMLDRLLKETSNCPQGPYKLIYYNISTGVAMAEKLYEMCHMPSNAVTLFCEYAQAEQ